MNTVKVAIAQAKKEILEDMASGQVPKTVASFNELHDYVDANMYGTSIVENYYFDDLIEVMTQVYSTLDAWIKHGFAENAAA